MKPLKKQVRELLVCAREVLSKFRKSIGDPHWQLPQGVSKQNKGLPLEIPEIIFKDL
jgi:hypothetical protein